jgi:hypothetical protein
MTATMRSSDSAADKKYSKIKPFDWMLDDQYNNLLLLATHYEVRIRLKFDIVNRLNVFEDSSSRVRRLHVQCRKGVVDVCIKLQVCPVKTCCLSTARLKRNGIYGSRKILFEFRNMVSSVSQCLSDSMNASRRPIFRRLHQPILLFLITVVSSLSRCRAAEFVRLRPRTEELRRRDA